MPLLRLSEGYTVRSVFSWYVLCSKRKVLIPSVQMNFLIQADTTLETLDPSINCSVCDCNNYCHAEAACHATGSAANERAAASQTPPSSHKLDSVCASDFELCLLFLRVTRLLLLPPASGVNLLCGCLGSSVQVLQHLCSWGGQDTCPTGIRDVTQTMMRSTYPTCHLCLSALYLNLLNFALSSPEL